ncbi:dual specificity phosphatase 3 [Cordyceps militaris]|uniref:Dual specificity phosphatase 3 n=1 Tax=Cordyceps militaris TaxID=73501 RepID=A0A2H4SVT8_CORMI|nr:dual specificity phosphatase 3 [Cordyceps militaris]
MHTTGLAGPSTWHRAVTPTAAYSRRPPSPPSIPTQMVRGDESSCPVSYTLKPTEDYLDAIQLTRAQLAAVTRGRKQCSVNRASPWVYEQRRYFHSILDYMSLGPVSVVRDRAYLAREQISMIVHVRDARMPPTRAVDDACRALPGLTKFEVAVRNDFDLLHQLPAIIHTINTHMIELSDETACQTDVTPRIGRILVTCATGNDLSALLVAGYVMAMFGLSTSKVVGFVSLQRFCCTFDEDIKRILQTWEDILKATAVVSRDRAATQNTARLPKSKRDVHDMMSSDLSTDDSLCDDMDRFTGREAFVPFMDMD